MGTTRNAPKLGGPWVSCGLVSFLGFWGADLLTIFVRTAFLEDV